MADFPRPGFLNSALQVAASPADLSRMLTDHDLALPQGAQAMFVLELIMQIAATEAMKRAAPPAA